MLVNKAGEKRRHEEDTEHTEEEQGEVVGH